MKGFWGGLLVLIAVAVLTAPAVAGEVEDLQRAVQELKEEVAALRAEKSLESSSVAKAVDEYLSSQAAEGGEVAGYLGGNFGLRSNEGDFKLNIGGGICFDARFYEPDATQNNTFDLSLVRLNVNGQVGDGWKWKIQPEFSTKRVALKDAYIETRTSAVFGETGSEYFDGIAWTFGQFKTPFSMSWLTDPYAIDTITRPTMVRALPIGRDIGVQLSNTIADSMIYWALAISNGTNKVNDTNEFWYWARVVASPWVNDEGALKNLHFGFSFGTAHTSEGCTPALSTAGGGPYGMYHSYNADYGQFYPSFDVRGREMLLGFEILWWLNQLAVKGEFFWLTQDLADYYTSGTSSVKSSGSDWWMGNFGSDSECETMGGYLAVCYMVTGEEWSEKPSAGLELVGQFEWGEVDPGGAIDEGDFMAFTLGANWYFSKNARFMLNWVTTDLGDYTGRAYMDEGRVRGGALDHNLLLRLQLTF
jgi:phosphate-selective porin